jgi:hypothetical protein
MRNGLFLMMAGAFLTYFWNESNTLFDPLPFGIALLVAAAIVIAPDIAMRLPHPTLAREFSLADNVLPERHHS